MNHRRRTAKSDREIVDVLCGVDLKAVSTSTVTRLADLPPSCSPVQSEAAKELDRRSGSDGRLHYPKKRAI